MRESYKPVDLGYRTVCWIWQGSLTKEGYGEHRLIYEQFKGPIPKGYDLHHKCKIRSCVNPDHLMPCSKRNHGSIHMGKTHNSSSMTEVTAIRLTKLQIASLKLLPPRISKSVLVRTLLQEYLSGNLPHINTLVLKEAARTEQAIDRTKF